MCRRCCYIFLLAVLLVLNTQLFARSIGGESPVSAIREVKSILLTGNYQTRDKTILTELPFVKGGLLLESEIPGIAQRAKENLGNTSLFNSVTVSFWYPNPGEVVFDIRVEERWYIWVFPVFEQEGRNFSDFLRLNDGSYFNYGLYLKHDNLRGRNENLKLRLVTGYKNQMIIDYENPGFNNRWGWGVNFSWMVFDQLSYATIDDKQEFLKVLGDRIMRQTRLQFSYLYRHNYDHRHRWSIAYLDDHAADTLLTVNPNYLPNGQKHNRMIEIGYRYQYDTRDSKVYPLKGNSYELSLLRKGLGLFSDYKGFFQGKFVASWQTQMASRLFGSSMITLTGVDKKEVPYVFRTGLGYEEYLNGFEYKVVDGSSFGAIQNKLLFELVPRKEKNLRFIPLKQFSKIHYAFYLKLHFDAGYVVNDAKAPENEMANSLLLGYGVGLDLVTFYDKVLSLNYSLNNFGGHGFFVHFNLVM